METENPWENGSDMACKGTEETGAMRCNENQDAGYDGVEQEVSGE